MRRQKNDKILRQEIRQLKGNSRRNKKDNDTRNTNITGDKYHSDC